MSTINFSLINSYNSLNLVNTLLGSSTSNTNSLSSLLSTVTGSTSLLSSTATAQQAVNLTTLGLVTASGALTSSNALTVFTGSSTQDATKIQSAVTAFVTAFNKSIDSLSGSSNAISQQSAKTLSSLASANATALSAIGITIDSDGKLVVDSTKLADAATNNQSAIQTAFNSTSFASNVSAASRSAISQSLGITSGAGFMSMYTSSASSQLLSSSLLSSYL
jgi:hypothetical protein